MSRAAGEFDALITRAAEADGSEALRFPPVVPRRQLEEIGYLKSFPHLAGTIFAARFVRRARREWTRMNEGNGGYGPGHPHNPNWPGGWTRHQFGGWSPCPALTRWPVGPSPLAAGSCRMPACAPGSPANMDR